MFYTTGSNTITVWHEDGPTMIIWWFNNGSITENEFGRYANIKGYYDREFKLIRKINSKVSSYSDVVNQLHKNNIMFRNVR